MLALSTKNLFRKTREVSIIALELFENWFEIQDCQPKPIDNCTHQTDALHAKYIKYYDLVEWWMQEIKLEKGYTK